MSHPVTTYRTVNGDVLDAIVHRHYGHGADSVGLVLRANPHLRHQPAVLPAGLTLTLPELPREAARPKVVLW